MITIIQRVSQAKVEVNQREIGKIKQGIMALVAIEKNDTKTQANRLLERILNYRIFADAEDKLNLSLRDINGGLLIVPQFTLAADTEKGNRPSFASAADPEFSRYLFNYFKQQAVLSFPNCQFGEFGANMQVSLINDGPITFTLKCQNKLTSVDSLEN